MTQQTEQDKIQLFHNALIQHGPLSNRIYMMKLKNACPTRLIPALAELAQSNGYTKIFVKVPACQAEDFLNAGYRQEAEVPGFYHGQEAAVFLGYFLGADRQQEKSLLDLDNILEIAQNKDKIIPEPDSLPDGAVLRWCIPDDAGKICDLYKQVFPSYPFPIHDPAYITETMLDHIVYFGIELNQQFIALSSAEMDTVSKNVEMTDFATAPQYRGNNLSGLLLAAMEKEMENRGIKTAYTIARAVSVGMNATFAKAGYTYGGRLRNNTNISGQIESMNVWYKSLDNG